MGALDDLFADLLTGGDIQRTATPGDSGDTGDKQASMRFCGVFEVGDKLATSGDKPPVPVGLSPNVATLSPIVNQPESEQRRHLSPMSPVSPPVPPVVLSPSPARTCTGCLHRLKPGTCGEPAAAGLTAKFEIAWPDEGYGTDCKAFTPRMPGNAPDAALAGLYRLSAADADRCHAPAWSDAEIATFEARVMLLRRRAIAAPDANELAECLTLRDRAQDERRMCVECSQLAERGRCLAAATDRLRGADRRLEPGPTILHRCEAFEPRDDLG